VSLELGRAERSTKPRFPRKLDEAMAVTTEASTGKYLPTAKVAERYGRTPRTIERWLVNEKLNFPHPVYINRFKYWNIDELETWERKRAAARVCAGSRVHTQINHSQNATTTTSQTTGK
jgi:hypothetical protein